MKNKLIGLGVLVAGIIALASCSNNANQPSDGGIPGGSITQTQSKSAIGYQLVTSSALIDQTSTSPARKLARNIKNATDVVTDDSDVVSLLNQLDVFASNKDDSVRVESKESDREGYTSLDVITYKGLSDKDETISMYYNVVDQKNDQDDDDDDDKDEQEQEIETRMEGIMVSGDVENAFFAKKEEETDTEETESSLSTRIYTSEDKKSYIDSVRKYEEETEDGKTETELTFEYKIVENGNVAKQFSYDFEVEDGEEEIDVHFGDGRFFVKMENENGKTIIRVKDKTTGETKRYQKVAKEDGTYTFEEITK